MAECARVRAIQRVTSLLPIGPEAASQATSDVWEPIVRDLIDHLDHVDMSDPDDRPACNSVMGWSDRRCDCGHDAAVQRAREALDSPDVPVITAPRPGTGLSAVMAGEHKPLPPYTTETVAVRLIDMADLLVRQAMSMETNDIGPVDPKDDDLVVFAVAISFVRDRYESELRGLGMLVEDE